MACNTGACENDPIVVETVDLFEVLQPSTDVFLEWVFSRCVDETLHKIKPLKSKSIHAKTQSRKEKLNAVGNSDNAVFD